MATINIMSPKQALATYATRAADSDLLLPGLAVGRGRRGALVMPGIMYVGVVVVVVDADAVFVVNAVGAGNGDDRIGPPAGAIVML